MLYDLDTPVKNISDAMRRDGPFMSIMPQEFQFGDTDVQFVYSDFGISKDVLNKLMTLTVRKNGIDRTFSQVNVIIERPGFVDPDTNEETVNKYVVAVFE